MRGAKANERYARIEKFTFFADAKPLLWHTLKFAQ